jgi:hypothetical protein
MILVFACFKYIHIVAAPIKQATQIAASHSCTGNGYLHYILIV